MKERMKSKQTLDLLLRLFFFFFFEVLVQVFLTLFLLASTFT